MSKITATRGKKKKANTIKPAKKGTVPSIIDELDAANAIAAECAVSPDHISALLRKRRHTTEQLAESLKVESKRIIETIEAMQARGSLVYRFGDEWGMERTPARNSGEHFYDSRPDGTYVFGFASDQHLASKYARADVLNDLYDKFSARGVDRVINCGNWIDGEARFNVHDLLVHGMDAQCEYLAEHYPQRNGLMTYAVAGDDHEGWYSAKHGVDIGRHAASIMADHGRTDWENLGYMEAFIALRHAKSGNTAQLLAMHPGGGSAYATSYKPQKIVESLQGGEKPAVLLIGHYHKLSYNVIRNVHAIQCGTSQDQTVFMRKKGIDAHVGGGICELWQDEETGAISRCRVEFFHYYNRGFYNGRWSHAGSVTHADRGVKKGVVAA